MKKIANQLKGIARQLSTLAKKTENMASAFEKTATSKTAKKKAAPAAKKKAAPKAKAGTPTDKVITIMKRYRKGVTVEVLRGKSGLNEKQISNIVHRACKKGKMRRVGRGIYSVYGL
jgi:hypothetical protein